MRSALLSLPLGASLVLVGFVLGAWVTPTYRVWASGPACRYAVWDWWGIVKLAWILCWQ